MMKAKLVSELGKSIVGEVGSTARKGMDILQVNKSKKDIKGRIEVIEKHIVAKEEKIRKIKEAVGEYIWLSYKNRRIPKKNGYARYLDKISEIYDAIEVYKMEIELLKERL